MTTPRSSFLSIDSPRRGRQPKTLELILAVIVSLSGAALVCILIALVTAHLFPHTVKYLTLQHFDNGTPMIVGTAVACALWPLSTLISSQGKRVFLCLMSAATLLVVSLDLSTASAGEPSLVELVTVVIHIVIAVVVFLSMVLLSPQWPPPPRVYDWSTPRWD
jgi:hypothetical protein